MTTLTVTAKGQVTLKKEIRDALGVGPGDKLDVEVTPDRKVVLSPVRGTGTWDDVFGISRDKVTRALTIEEMNEIIADGWAGRL